MPLKCLSKFWKPANENGKSAKSSIGIIFLMYNRFLDRPRKKSYNSTTRKILIGEKFQNSEEGRLNKGSFIIILYSDVQNDFKMLIHGLNKKNL